jgi:septal ring factor EnvC (AmiA/AmiB activator)
MHNASETLYRLKPVTYRYRKEIDRRQSLEYGLIAEDVAEIDPNLTVCNKDGHIESVRYTAINAMLLNEFLKEHRKVQEQEATITQLKKDFGATVAQLATRLDEQAAQIQKVSAQLEVNRGPGVSAGDSLDLRISSYMFIRTWDD